MILTDPPYGTTACNWDSVIPFNLMWEKINNLYNNGSSCLLFGSEPFSTKLRCSNFNNYRYDIYWIKTKASLYQHAKNRPMKQLETISVFSPYKWGHISQVKDRMNYYPQGIRSSGIKTVTKNYNAGRTVGERKNQIGKKYESFTGFPTDVLFFSNVIGKKAIHPTQKPVDLLEYLIKTYTNEGDTVLDFTMGSGSTGVACLNTNRNFIGIELDQKYYNIAKTRLQEAEK
jgi:site-specific DNA-methyltransferase (adenine-specific)